MSLYNYSRRTLLKVGALGGCLSLSNFFNITQQQSGSTQDRSAILVFLKGGPAHQDTFDLKPNAKREFRGEFKPIRTNVPGIEICEHLPQLARVADHYTIVRGIAHNLAAHDLGVRYLMTGNRPTPAIAYPSFGSVVNKECDAHPDLPGYVAVDRDTVGPGYLGTEFGPLATGSKPRYGRPFRVRGVTLDDGLTIEKFRDRRKLLKDIDTAFQGYDQLDESVRSLGQFSEKAYNIISSARSRNAFDLSAEPRSEIDRFGKHEFGQSLLLTARLIEAGVRFVTVILEDWDTHSGNFSELAGRLLPPFDSALSGLFTRLKDRGLLESTSVLVTGEFGRTPKVNGKAGRDHWARAMFSLMAGGGIAGGRVIGATDKNAAEPVEGNYSPDDIAASFMKNIGIDPKIEYQTNIGRPVTLIRDGNPIKELF